MLRGRKMFVSVYDELMLARWKGLLSVEDINYGGTNKLVSCICYYYLTFTDNRDIILLMA